MIIGPVPELYLLDTAILLHLVRGSTLADVVERAYKLTSIRTRPLICEVTLGEMRAFSKSLSWGPTKRARLDEIQRDLVLVGISEDRVLEAYADLSSEALSRGWSIFHGKNDLWVGAAAKAAGARLITTDRDFLPVRDHLKWSIDVLDPHTGAPVS